MALVAWIRAVCCHFTGCRLYSGKVEMVIKELPDEQFSSNKKTVDVNDVRYYVGFKIKGKMTGTGSHKTFVTCKREKNANMTGQYLTLIMREVFKKLIRTNEKHKVTMTNTNR